MFRLATKSVVTSCTRRSGVGAATAAAAVAAALIASKSGSGECEAPPRDPAIAAATDKGGEPWAPFNNSAGSTCNGRLRTLYPPLEPYNSGCLRVSKKHSIYWEESGCREGKPVIFLHGGPGAGCCGASSSARRFHDPKKYRIITFDQRGSGNSLPSGCLEDNSTWSLVADIEHLRRMLKIDKWQVFGGSWGSFLALAYAEKHPDRCTELVLRGIFMLRPEELRWFYQEGANHIYPDAWEHYVAAIPLDEQNDFMTAFRKRLTGADEEERLKAARAWSTWELVRLQACELWRVVAAARTHVF
jgi:proline iminopeptidase